nr:uncharacterized protein LOC112030014 [Quercus suber]
MPPTSTIIKDTTPLPLSNIVISPPVKNNPTPPSTADINFSPPVKNSPTTNNSSSSPPRADSLQFGSVSAINLPPLTNSTSQSSAIALSDLPVAPVLVTAEDCHVEPHSSIKNFVEDLEHTWGNSEKWVLELRGGRQIATPPSLYHSPRSLSDFSDLEGAVGQGNNTFKEEGHIVSWANECEGALDNVSLVSGSDCELGESNGGLVNWENDKEPLVVQPLAMANPVAPLVEVADTSTQLSPWVEKRIKAFRKSVGTSLEGFEAEITGIFLALVARKKAKMQVVCSQKREPKTSSKGHRELKILLNSWNFENNPDLVGDASGERDSMVPQ